MQPIQKKIKSLKLFGFYGSILTFAASCSNISTIEPEYGDGVLSCVGQNCTAVGQYFKIGNPNSLPLAVFSQNGGQTFDFASEAALPPDADANKGTQLFGVKCFQQQCVGVGLYNLFTTMQAIGGLPFITFSNNSGKTFTSAIRPALPIDWEPNKISALRAVTNIRQRIIGVGTYNVGLDTGAPLGFPYVVVSDLTGKQFTTAFRAPVPPDAAASPNGMLYGISCVEDHCVAAGEYAISSTVNRPLLIISDDGGLTFKKFAKISISNTANSAKSMSLRGISCEGQHCIAGGYYYAQGSNTGTLPLVLNSTDGGLTFSMSTTTMPDNTDYNINAAFKSISCAGLRCVAVGYYNFDTMTFQSNLALSAFSTDGGLTFTAATVPGTTDTTKLSELTGSACVNKKCIGVGLYNVDITQSPPVGSPFAIFSPNNQSVFTTYSQPALPTGANLMQLNSLGDIQP